LRCYIGTLRIWPHVIGRANFDDGWPYLEFECICVRCMGSLGVLLREGPAPSKNSWETWETGSSHKWRHKCTCGRNACRDPWQAGWYNEAMGRSPV